MITQWTYYDFKQLRMEPMATRGGKEEMITGRNEREVSC